MDSGDDRSSTAGMGSYSTLIPGPASALIYTRLLAACCCRHSRADPSSRQDASVGATLRQSTCVSGMPCSRSNGRPLRLPPYTALIVAPEVLICSVENPAKNCSRRISGSAAARAFFGYSIPPYISAESAIASFPTTATAIGVGGRDTGFECCAPLGLENLFSLVVRPNRAQITASIYQAKVARWRPLWPHLTFMLWDDAARRRRSLRRTVRGADCADEGMLK
jgi:hypothetical protein